jgi:hypothetical protein
MKTAPFIYLLGFITFTIACNTAPPAPKAEVKADNWAVLAQAKDKYPQDLQILDEKSFLNQTIRTVLTTPALYGAFAERMAIQTPIEVADSVVFIYACAGHACGYDEAAVCTDLRQHKIWVAIVDAGKAQVYTDAAADVKQPMRLQTYLAQL